MNELGTTGDYIGDQRVEVGGGGGGGGALGEGGEMTRILINKGRRRRR